MMLNGFGIELSQPGRIGQVIEKETRLLGNLGEGKIFYAQSGLFRSAVTGGFSGAQISGLLLSEHSTRQAVGSARRQQPDDVSEESH